MATNMHKMAHPDAFKVAGHTMAAPVKVTGALHVGTLHKLEIAPGQFEYLAALETQHHSYGGFHTETRDPLTGARGIQSLYRLKDNGYLIVDANNQGHAPNNGFTRADANRVLAENGHFKAREELPAAFDAVHADMGLKTALPMGTLAVAPVAIQSSPKDMAQGKDMISFDLGAAPGTVDAMVPHEDIAAMAEMLKASLGTQGVALPKATKPPAGLGKSLRTPKSTSMPPLLGKPTAGLQTSVAPCGKIALF